MSGAGHLTSFTGTDTVPAIDFIEEYYNPETENYLIAGSVPATEHSVMCAGGQDDEEETYNRLLNLYPSGILSVVSDTWDLWKVLTETVPNLKDKILARDGKLVIRPDSGDPVLILTGDPKAEKGSPAFKGVVQLLWDTFGGTVTSLGYKVLDEHIGVIYGDGINFQRAGDILARLEENGFASNNVVFGMGSYTYQMTTRDVYGFAMKATHVTINGVGTDIFKKPVTDDGGKTSHRGRLAVLEGPDGEYKVVQEASGYFVVESALKPVWRNGEFLRRFSFEEVRANTRK
jgi:nicotinamide phosphoribosyltransferase